MVIRALIVDDEPIARRRILRLLAAESDIEVIGECGNGRDAVAAIRQHSPEVVFLDVQMPELDGFAVLNALDADDMPAVIFVTAFDAYAIRAFDVHALDYLLKPFTTERFNESLQRMRTQLLNRSPDQLQRIASLLEAWNTERQELQQQLAASREPCLDRVMVKSGDHHLFVRLEDVAWIEAKGNYLRLHSGAQSYLLRTTMAALETRLDARRFVRIHRSTIVNLDRVKEMRPWFGGDQIMVLDTGIELKVSRGYRGRLPDRSTRA